MATIGHHPLQWTRPEQAFYWVNLEQARSVCKLASDPRFLIMKLSLYRKELANMKLLAKDRRRMNQELAALSSTRHPHLPIATINALIAPFHTEEAIYCGREGRCSLEIGADNALLVLYWLKGEYDGLYEINAYVS